MNTRQMIIATLKLNAPFKLTAMEISRRIGESPASVSSLLVRMTDRGEIQRRHGYGPRGGSGYFIKTWK